MIRLKASTIFTIEDQKRIAEFKEFKVAAPAGNKSEISVFLSRKSENRSNPLMAVISRVARIGEISNCIT